MQIIYHWQAVALAAAAGWVLFVLWFSPFIFGGPWQRLEQLSDEGVRAGLLPRLGFGLVVCAAQALCLAGFFNFTQSVTPLQGALAALQLCLGLAVPAGLTFLVMARRPLGLAGIYFGWLILAQVAAGAVLGGLKQ